ncbi:hypothetical protein B0I35DRAFT_501164 [Stachybotrys elegans]|uniref:C2H2-type domain-containing protein n=1 Tax=Stachybotrys elegans TaxID=80388 RepID=A0A8K0WS84_9HYPO|nr:hypothetical protein B0I35DRAFT_501164 [Stachybotrys elegans]
MPRAQEDDGFTKHKSTSTVKHQKDRHPTQKDSIGSRPNKTRSRTLEEECGLDCGEVLTGSSGCRTSCSKQRYMKVEDQCTNIVGLASPSGQADERNEAHTTRQSHPKGSLSSSAFVEQQVTRQIQKRKHEIIESLMASILECVNQRIDMLEGRCGEAGGACAASAPGRPSGHLPVGSRSIGYKRQLQKDDEDEIEGDDSDNAQRTKNPKRVRTSDSEQRFACPYYKYDPERFATHRTCCGPGFAELNRLKEHLLRRHRRFECTRCYKLFEKEKDLNDHQRLPKPCKVKDQASKKRDFGDGFDQNQEKELKKRLRREGVEKWKLWYCTLFGFDPNSTDIPSPYFETSETQDVKPRSRACSKHAGYFNHFRAVLPGTIKTIITDEVNRAIDNYEDKIKDGIWSKLKDLPMKLHRVIESIQPPPGEAYEDDGAALVAPPNFNPDELWGTWEFAPEDGFDFRTIGVADTDSTGVSSTESYSRSAGTIYNTHESDTSFELEENNLHTYDWQQDPVPCQPQFYP